MLEQALRIATRAGEVLMRHHGRLRRVDARRKEGRRDLVSEADLEAERCIVEAIPGEDDVLSEEGSSRDRGAPRRWVCDPLDGTVNFLHGIPFWCVSIAGIEDGELRAGVVHAPELGLTFTAAAGGGCFLNGSPIAVSGTGDLGESVLATGFAYRCDEIPDHNFDNFQALGFASAGLRRMGSAALDLAYVAAGKLDGFWEMHLRAWDVAAGALLVREAGGKVTDFRGSGALDDVLLGRNLVASNGRIHDAIRAKLAPVRGL
jgi:myo-inositol-1(or 4)-monophosphatase